MALYASILTGGTNNHTTTSQEANYISTDFIANGIVGAITNTSGVAPATGGFACNAQGTPDMTIAVTAGGAYVTGTPSGQSSQTFRATLSANQNVTISANSSGSTKYDWVYIKLDPTNAANPNLAGDNVFTLTTSRSSSSTSDNGTPPTYGYCIAVVTVANGASSITNGNITDKRVITSIGSQNTALTTGWVTNALPAVSSVTANGNRSYTITFASTVASILSSGMRLRTTRTSAAPTQCTSLNGSTQYWFKTSPNKLTFTDDFVVSAWVKLSSYQLGGIAGRLNGTDGWALRVNADGTVTLSGYNGAFANYSRVTSYQSIPLNKWVHITAQLDMSAFTATTTTSYVMFDGKDVPASVSRGGTNPTALTAAGSFVIGWTNDSGFLSGKIAQVAIYNAKVTQATILATISQGLSGSETSLASAYSFNNAVTDLNTTTPNDLSVGGGSAVATNADSPFGNAGASSTLDYALVQSISTTTATVQVPEGCTIPTSGGVTSVDYSTQANPFGWVSDKGRWLVENLTIAGVVQAFPAAGTWYNLGSMKLTIPVGAFSVSYEADTYFSSSAAAPIIASTLSTSSSAVSDQRFTSGARGPAAGSFEAHLVRTNIGLSLSAATDYYLNHKQEGTGGGTWSLQIGASDCSRIMALPSNL